MTELTSLTIAELRDGFRAGRCVDTAAEQGMRLVDDRLTALTAELGR